MAHTTIAVFVLLAITVTVKSQEDPVVFGFNQTEFRGMERGERYAVEVGFLSGGSSSLVVATISLNLGTAGRNDVQLGTTFVRIFPGPPDQTQLVTFSLLVDSTAQELDETFNITFTITTPDPPPVVSNVLQGTIVDRNEVFFQFTEDDYLINENQLIMPVLVAKDPSQRLANPVTLRVTPLTVNEAVLRGIIEDTLLPNNSISPNRAQEADFNGTVIEITYPVDEGLPSPIANVRASIPVVDDTIDEAEEQQFIAFLEVTNAINLGGVDNSVRNTTICRINDDDPLQIGFQQRSYNFTEPRSRRLIRDVIILKENNAVTEQRYSVIITTSTPANPLLNAATLEPVGGGIYDYSLGQPGQNFLQQDFQPNQQNVTFPFILNGDTFPEGVEAFQATITPAEGFPTYGNPTTLFTTTLIDIMDDDVAVVGFERPEYFVNETEGFVEVCVIVTNPPANVDLVFSIITEYQTRTGTASGTDFTQIEPFTGFNQFPANSPIRRDCFNVTITNDDITEIDETFTLVLRQDPLSPPSSSILIQPNTTIVTISDGVASTTLPPTTLPLTTLSPNTSSPITPSPTTPPPTTPLPTTPPPTTPPPTTPSPTTPLPTTPPPTTPPPTTPSPTTPLPTTPPPTTPPTSLPTTMITPSPLIIGYLEDVYRVAEDDEVVSIDIGVRSGRIRDEEVLIQIFLFDNSANSMDDYSSEINESILVFNSNNTRYTIQVPIVNDTISEPTEMFEGSIALLNITSQSVSLFPTLVRIIITDDDSVVIGFDRELYNVNERDGTAVVRVRVISGILSTDIDVQFETFNITATSGNDYDSVTSTLTFTESVTIRDVHIPLIDDNVPEPEEVFMARLSSDAPSNILTLDPANAMIVITDDDSVPVGIPVNDTVIGDPLVEVPILVSEAQLNMLGADQLSLCYEVHGRSGQWFNLVTDECASVNAQYVATTRSVNIIDQIGVRALDSSNQCVNIRVNINGCSAEVNGIPMMRYSSGGISVRRYSNRVRISVPNCASISLVMWVICEKSNIEGQDIDAIKFVVMRGLNFGRQAHGLLGQFWNIPVGITPYIGQTVDGTPEPSTLYIVNITTNTNTRLYVGRLHQVGWEGRPGPCLYVGNRQAGRIAEIEQPNDGVIEGNYMNYRVSSAFSEENYMFGLFSESRCS